MERLLSNKKDGFTLIELLVVIAIIGILSSVMLVALNSARQRARDSRVISSMSQLRSLAEVVYDDTATDSYGDIKCTSYGSSSTGCGDSSMKQLYDDIYAQGGDLDSDNNGTEEVFSGGGKYCIQAEMPSGNVFCVDSEGHSGTSNVSCDSTGYDCD